MNDVLKAARIKKLETKEIKPSKEVFYKVEKAKLQALFILLDLDNRINIHAKKGYLNICETVYFWGKPAIPPNYKHIVVQYEDYGFTKEILLTEDNSDYHVWNTLVDGGYEPLMECWHDGVGIRSSVAIVLKW